MSTWLRSATPFYQKPRKSSLSDSRRSTPTSFETSPNSTASPARTSSDGQSQNGKNETLNPYDDPQIVDQYDETYVTKIGEIEDRRIQALLAPLAESAHVLDIGAGTGLVLHLTKPALYAATDSSELMLSKITARHSSVFTVQADLNTEAGRQHLAEQVAPLAPFDLITCIFAAHLVHEPELYETAFELLAPGGTIVHHGNLIRRRRRAGDLYPDCNIHETDQRFTVKTLRQDLTSAGFENVDIVGLNAIPDKVTNVLSRGIGLRLMTASRHIPARWHFHVAGIGRKPYD